MQAKWLTRDDARKIHCVTKRNALAMVMGAFPEWSEKACSVLLETCQFNWSRGPIPTAAILSQAAGLILKAWEMRDHIAGVLLLRDGEGFTPIYLHRVTLALMLESPTALWIEFDGALRGAN